MNNKVYVITRGEYSNYHICAVTMDEEKAQRLRMKYTCEYEKAEIEEYPLDDEMVYIPEYIPVFKVQFYKDGKNEISLSHFVEKGTENPPKYKIEKHKKLKSDYRNYRGEDLWEYYDVSVVMVAAKDRGHALKIASDVRAQKKAEEEGVC